MSSCSVRALTTGEVECTAGERGAEVGRCEHGRGRELGERRGREPVRTALDHLSELVAADAERLPVDAIDDVDRRRLDDPGDTTPLGNVVELFYPHSEHYNLRIPTPIQDALVEENRRKILGLG